MTEKETALIIKKLHDIYSSQDKFVTAEEIASRITYWDIYFKDFSFKVVNAVADDWIRHQSKMPLPSEILPLCKDARDLMIMREQDLAHPELIKPTWELIWDERHNYQEPEITPEIRRMSDEFVKWLEADSKTKEKIKNDNNLGNAIPYEI